MYNIAKVAKGEILLYFNEVFDALCKVHQQKHVDKWLNAYIEAACGRL